MFDPRARISSIGRPAACCIGLKKEAYPLQIC